VEGFMTTPEAPREHYTADYFHKWNYADRPLGRFSMYWFARRYYAALVRRYAPPGGPERKLYEMGCGLGDLLGLLQDEFICYGADLIPYSVEATRRAAPRAVVWMGDAADFSEFEPQELSVIVALHLMEHLPAPRQALRDAFAVLQPGGLFLFATPHPEYSLRRFKDRENDAIGKDKTHINCHVPAVWRQWSEEAGFQVVKQFGDGLWDVPYLPLLPKPIQFAMFGLPALAQVLTQTTWMPLALGVNQINILRKPG
jgi:SAM-dependent methyltransferase